MCTIENTISLFRSLIAIALCSAKNIFTGADSTLQFIAGSSTEEAKKAS